MNCLSCNSSISRGSKRCYECRFEAIVATKLELRALRTKVCSVVECNRIATRKDGVCYICAQRRWQAANPERCKEYNKRDYELNGEKIRAANKAYRKTPEGKKTRREGHKRREQRDLGHKIARRIRNRIYCALTRQDISASATKLLGCSIDHLKQHLESKFQLGMNWSNYGKGGWELDHVEPLCSFDLTAPEQLAKACHYTNLQPLWAEDNVEKSKLDSLRKFKP